jgi:chemotaxis protein methyltransferase CheR
VVRVDDPTSDGGIALQHLLRKVTVGETTFFRHSEDLEWLRDSVLPRAVAKRAERGEKRIRIWSAGCSTGEEAYTLAAIALTAVPDPEWQVQVLGTDINSHAIGAAKRASYGDWSFRGVSPELKERWFEPVESGRWRPIAKLRSLVEFDYLNLRDPIYPAIFTRTTELDVIVCRNVFIYFFPDTVRSTLDRFAACLVEAGTVLCGPSDLFHAVKGSVTALSADPSGAHRLRLGPSLERAPRMPTPSRITSVKPGPKLAAVKPAPAQTVTWKNVVPLLSAGRYADAARAAAELLVKDPLSMETARCHALALAASSSSEAKAAWRRVLYLDPTDAGAHFGLGMVLMREGKQEDARVHFRAVGSLLRGREDGERLAGFDEIPVGWLRAACRKLAESGGRPT